MRTGGVVLNLTDTREKRRFGVIAFLFFGGLFSLGLWAGKAVPIYLFGSLCLLGLCLICLPEPLDPVYRGWLKVAHWVSRIVTATMLIIAYYVVITPSAMLKRIFGGRPLPIKPDRDAVSYWVARTEPAQPKERFIKRY